MGELTPLLEELCHYSNIRNQINLKRHRARYRKAYYQKAIHVLEAHNDSNSKLRYLRSQLGTYTDPKPYKSQIADLKAQIMTIERYMANLRKSNPNPKKWKKMGLIQLRSLTLKYEGEYAIYKHELMEHTLRTTKRVRHIIKKLKCSVAYDNGSVTSIYFSETDRFLNSDDIKRLAHNFEINKSVEDMLKE